MFDMDILFTYLIEKGGIFGVLFAISLTWIIIREKSMFNNAPRKHHEEHKKQESSSSEMLYILNDLKKNSENMTDFIAEFSPEIKAIRKTNYKITEGLTTFNSSLDKLDSKSDIVISKLDDIWELHSAKDHEGIPMIYTKRNYESLLKEIIGSVEELNKVISTLPNLFKEDIDKRLEKTNNERISELKVILENYNKTVTELILALEKIKTVLRY